MEPKSLIGKKIKNIRPMTKAEQKREDWFTQSTVIVLEDDTLLYPSQDPEGNDAGALFAYDPKTKKTYGFF